MQAVNGSASRLTARFYSPRYIGLAALLHCARLPLCLRWGLVQFGGWCNAIGLGLSGHSWRGLSQKIQRGQAKIETLDP